MYWSVWCLVPDRYLYHLSVCCGGVCVGHLPSQWLFSLNFAYFLVFILLLLLVGLIWVLCGPYCCENVTYLVAR